MSLNYGERKMARFDATIDIIVRATEDFADLVSRNSELVDLSNRLLLTPPFIWRELFKLGIKPDEFWKSSLDAFKLTASWGFTLDRLTLLSDACMPNEQKEVDISLNGVLPPAPEAFNIIFDEVKGQAQQALFEVPQSTTNAILKQLSTEEYPLARYRRELIQGKSRFPFKNLIDGGIRYSAPTILEKVDAYLTYPRSQVMPIVSLKVRPIPGS